MLELANSAATRQVPRTFDKPQSIGLLTAARDFVALIGQRISLSALGRRPYQSKSGSIDFVEEIPTRPHRDAQASTVLAA